MRKDKKTIALIAFAAVLLVLLSALPLEPRWKGRSLSYWVLVNGGSKRDDHYDPKYAISQIGSNAVPYLLKWMKQKPSSRHIWFRNFKGMHPFMGKFVLDWMTGSGVELRARYAIEAFECLRESGASAIPELSRFATNLSDFYMAEHATSALCNMGTNSTPVLLAIITNQQAYDRPSIIYYLGKSGTVQAIPAMLRCLRDPDPYVSSTAAAALGQLKQEPTTVAPALVELLKRPIPDSDLQHGVHLASILRALGAFGTNSYAATPELLRMLGESTDDSPSCEIMKCLTEITMQPEIAIAALTNHLNGTNGLLRHCAALSLSTMGAPAESALPSLTNSLKFADTRKMVTVAIRRISSSVLEKTVANCVSTNELLSSVMQMITEHWTNQPALIPVTKETPEPAWLACLKRNSALLGASIVIRESPTNSSVRMAFGGGFARYMELEIGPPTYQRLRTTEGVYRHTWFPGAYIYLSRDP